MGDRGKLHAVAAQDEPGDLVVGCPARVVSRDDVAQQRQLVPFDPRRSRVLVLAVLGMASAPPMAYRIQRLPWRFMVSTSQRSQPAISISTSETLLTNWPGSSQSAITTGSLELVAM